MSRPWAAPVLTLLAMQAMLVCAPWAVGPFWRGLLAGLIAIVSLGTYTFALDRRTRWIPCLYRELRRPGWILALKLTCSLASVLILLAWLTGAWHASKPLGTLDKPPLHWATVKLPTVAVQQILLQLVLVPLFRRWRDWPRVAVVVGATCFSLCHLPNPVLMLLTLVAGLCWTAAFLKHAQLAPLIVSHFALAILAATVGGEYILNMRVGESCCELYPSRVAFENRTVIVFPDCVSGSVERLYQEADELILEGWASDLIHGQPPTALWIHVGKRLLPLEVDFGESHPRDRFLHATRSCFQTRLRIDAFFDVEPGGSATVYAANANGWLCPLGRMGEIAPHSLAPLTQKTQLYPTELDGRINRVLETRGRVRIQGWTADLIELTVPNELWVRAGGRLIPIDLSSSRRSRPDIKASFDSESLLQSGFDVELTGVSPWLLGDLSFYMADEDDVLHPVPMTRRARVQVASLRSGLGETLLR